MTAAAALARLAPTEPGLEPGRDSLVDLHRTRGRRERRPCAGGGRLTLERKLGGVWEGLLAAGAADCPMCGGAMARKGVNAGRCGGCGTAIR